MYAQCAKHETASPTQKIFILLFLTHQIHWKHQSLSFSPDLVNLRVCLRRRRRFLILFLQPTLHFEEFLDQAIYLTKTEP